MPCTKLWGKWIMGVQSTFLSALAASCTYFCPEILLGFLGQALSSRCTCLLSGLLPFCLKYLVLHSKKCSHELQAVPDSQVRSSPFPSPSWSFLSLSNLETLKASFSWLPIALALGSQLLCLLLVIGYRVYNAQGKWVVTLRLSEQSWQPFFTCELPVQNMEPHVMLHTH